MNVCLFAALTQKQQPLKNANAGGQARKFWSAISPGHKGRDFHTNLLLTHSLKPRAGAKKEPRRI